MFSPADTIVALATAPVPAGIGVVRISGPRAHEVARVILTVRHELEPRLATLTHARGTAVHTPESPIPNPQSLIPTPQFPTIDQVVATYFPAPPAPADQTTAGFGEAPPLPRAIDEVVATFFPAPHSYTAEDVVEISAHGGLALVRSIVRAAVDAGARLAEPGEFTLRAFLNGRVDLVQAEAVADLVDAVTPLQARVAFDQLEGTLTRAIGALDRELFDLAARLEASVDFPDEGYHFVAPGEACAALCRVRDGIDGLLATSRAGRVIREGRHIAILGKPNVGKSSLFNQLVGTDRAIVAAGPGTTRDMLRETIDLDGIRLGLVDTAGIRASDDEVEREGVARARGAASVADLVVLVLDRSRPLEEVDEALLRETAAAPRVVVVNKTDLPAAWDVSEARVGIGDPRLRRIAIEAASARQAGLETRERADTLSRTAGGGEACREPLGEPDKRASRVLSAERGAPLRGGDATAAPSPREDFGPSGAFVVHSDSACSHGSPHASPPPGSGEGVNRESRAPLAAPRSRPAQDVGDNANPGSRIPNPGRGAVLVSLKSGEGVGELRAAMRAALDVAEPVRDAPMVTNVRHETLLRQAREALARAIENIEQAGPSTPPGTGESASEELVLADLADARRAFEEVTGKRTTEDVLRRIFEKFCVGK